MVIANYRPPVGHTLVTLNLCNPIETCISSATNPIEVTPTVRNSSVVWPLPTACLEGMCGTFAPPNPDIPAFCRRPRLRLRTADILGLRAAGLRSACNRAARSCFRGAILSWALTVDRPAAYAGWLPGFKAWSAADRSARAALKLFEKLYEVHGILQREVLPFRGTAA